GKQHKLSRTEAGRLGGNQTKKRHGRQHFVAIGRKGFLATCRKHYRGDRRAMLNELIRRGLMAMDPRPRNGHWQHYQAFPDPPKKTEPEEENPVVAFVLASIRSAPIPECPL